MLYPGGVTILSQADPFSVNNTALHDIDVGDDVDDNDVDDNGVDDDGDIEVKQVSHNMMIDVVAADDGDAIFRKGILKKAPTTVCNTQSTACLYLCLTGL